MRRRLTATATAAVLVALVVVTTGFYLLLSAALEHDADGALRALAEAALSTVRVDGDGIAMTDGPGDATLDASTWVLDADGVAVTAPVGSPVAAADVLSLAGVTHETFVNVDPQTRLLAVPVTAAPAGATVVVSLSLAPYETSERTALTGAVVLGVVILALVALVTRWLVGAALRPVDAMTTQAAQWVAHDLDRRFRSPGRDEIGRLGATLDDLLDRLAASLRHERHLTDEIAHELRTPLARARADAEVTLASDESDDAAALRTALAAIIDDIDEIGATVDTLLGSARHDPTAGAVASVRDAVRAATSSTPGGPTDVSPAPDLRIACDEKVLVRLLVPVLQNAHRHAAGHVAVSWTAAGQDVRIDVVDDGPGIDPGEVDAVFLPGVRGRNAEGMPGTGLGLTLSRRLARSCGGDVSAAPGPGGRVRITLPLAPDEP